MRGRGCGLTWRGGRVWLEAAGRSGLDATLYRPFTRRDPNRDPKEPKQMHTLRYTYIYTHIHIYAYIHTHTHFNNSRHIILI